MAADPDHDDELSPTARAPSSLTPTQERLRLDVVSGPDAGRSLPLRHGTYSVGKSSACDLTLTDPQVSRRHLELTVQPLGILVRDLGSTNGSYHHHSRITEALLGAGALITVGNTRLALARQGRPATFAPSTADRFGRLLGRARAMRELFAVLERVAQSNAAVLIEAETGAGKELCAEAIHQASGRPGPFAVCDLAGIPRTLIESELFGHVRGAFTGAIGDHAGAFETADRGTLFLDEIGELELEQQPRLLRMLDAGAVRRVGGSSFRTVDVRVIAATNRDLRREVADGRFRSDLYHRLAVVRVTIPPLRERKEDLPFLVEHFLEGSGRVLSPTSLGLFEEHEWPGNVRELANVIKRGLAFTRPGETIEPEHLGLEVGAAASVDPIAPYHESKQRLIDSWERAYVERVLGESNGNVSAAARRVGLGRAYLYRLMRKYGLGGGAVSGTDRESEDR